MKDLRDRVVVVTGATSGIGRATAGAFARAGAIVHLADIDGDGAEAAAAEIRGALGRASAHRVDCTDAAQVEELARSVYEAEGRVDVVHNNAGVCCGGSIETIPLEDWRWSVDSNVWSVIHGVRAFVPRMIEQGKGGHIVNTASMAGLIGLPYMTPYCATKFAVVGLSESLAFELGMHGIRVTTVCPGAVRTNVMRCGRINLPGSWRERMTGIVDRRAKSPEDLAAEILGAVRKDKSLVISAGDMYPLWLIKRTSARLYATMGRGLTALARRRGG